MAVFLLSLFIAIYFLFIVFILLISIFLFTLILLTKIKNENMIPHDFKFVVMTAEQYEALSNDISRIKNSVEQFLGVQSLVGEYYTSAEVRKKLGISPKTWQTYRDERRIAFVQFGRKIYVKKSDLDAFMEEHKIGSRK
jgi:DNA binding domain, excisionase family